MEEESLMFELTDQIRAVRFLQLDGAEDAGHRYGSGPLDIVVVRHKLVSVLREKWERIVGVEILELPYVSNKLSQEQPHLSSSNIIFTCSRQRLPKRSVAACMNSSIMLPSP